MLPHFPTKAHSKIPRRRQALQAMLLAFTLTLGAKAAYAEGNPLAILADVHGPALQCHHRELKNSKNEVLKAFSDEGDCEESIRSAHAGFFCAIETDGASLMSTQGDADSEYASFPECLRELNKKVGGFVCRNNLGQAELWNLLRNKMVFSFTFDSDCARAESEALSDLICVSDQVQHRLLNDEGQVLADFAFESDCEQKRGELLRD